MRHPSRAAVVAASLGLQIAPAAADSIESPFVFAGGRAQAARCDGSPPRPVAIGGAYADVASRVHGLRHALLNARVLTVDATVEHLPRAGGGSGEVLAVTAVRAEGPRVECNLTGVDRPLVGTRWMLPREAEPSGPMSSAPEPFSFRIGTDGRVEGFDGCNSFSGRATARGRSFVVHDLVSTLIACPPTATPAPAMRPGRYDVTIRGRRLQLSPPGLLFVANDER